MIWKLTTRFALLAVNHVKALVAERAT